MGSDSAGGEGEEGEGACDEEGLPLEMRGADKRSRLTL